MGSIITSGITPAMIPGIRKAIEVCEEYGEENIRIAHDDIKRVCALPGHDVDDFDFSNMHGVRWHAGREMANILRHLIGEGDDA
ncbi:hypothetical protein [Acetobacter senegalensis]|uniref:hypothetical protein n=1 Tax=Acetobacter senegalensis TaxID=446692 RepID=UPI001EDAF781|nr:hypothetical protein [Acetobacter senegalensis]MCG4256933.1 hypothetical protein [Acetobacter senegalensis]MCG4266929.1 hypothetical protein [Acetobacter senegalensis]MCG4273888.1 hypothetical protein [Acetobacter senegalensis]